MLHLWESHDWQSFHRFPPCNTLCCHCWQAPPIPPCFSAVSSTPSWCCICGNFPRCQIPAANLLPPLLSLVCTPSPQYRLTLPPQYSVPVLPTVYPGRSMVSGENRTGGMRLRAKQSLFILWVLNCNSHPHIFSPAPAHSPTSIFGTSATCYTPYTFRRLWRASCRWNGSNKQTDHHDLAGAKITSFVCIPSPSALAHPPASIFDTSIICLHA